jgi:retron-type reverse transcriptase
MNYRDIENFSGGGGNHNRKINKLEIFEKIISLENLFSAWLEFKKGKNNKKDVQLFEYQLEDNLFQLHNDLKNRNYQHSYYTSFFVQDPKLRHIHKASVRDRILHHAIVKIIEPVFEKTFIFDSYSSRKNKGVHRAIVRFKRFAWKLSQNNINTVWILKCDIRKFFDSINHQILEDLIGKKIYDIDLIALVHNIICSYNNDTGTGIPLGNLTSQLFSNVYLNELDQFIKRKLKVKYYIRYADDIVIICNNKFDLERLLFQISNFLKENLKIQIHPNKIFFGKWHQGVDFLGYVIFPCHIILRTKTKKRIFNKMGINKKKFIAKIISREKLDQSKQSYLGILNHCRGSKIRLAIENYSKLR